MGPFSRWFVRRYRDPVVGTAEIVAIEWHGVADDGGTQRRSRVMSKMHVALRAPSLDRVEVTRHKLAPNLAFPKVGETLPVTIDRARPKRFTVHWDEREAPSNGPD